MNKTITYKLFLFLSTFTRGLVEVFSLVLLYKKGFSLNNIFFFLFIMYTLGIIINYISLRLSYKLVLIISSILYGISYIYLSLMTIKISSLIILALLLASSNYSYHAIRHLLAIELLNNRNKPTNKLITITYLGVIISSLVGIYLIEKLSLSITSIIIFIISFISILPILKLKDNLPKISKINFKKVNISKSKILFNILEQFKVIFLEIQPLFLYIYIDKSIYYIGIFNIIINIASLIVISILTKYLSKKHFKLICILLGIILTLKLNIKSGIILMFIAFFEGIFIKFYEFISLNTLYNLDNNKTRDYLITEESIFFGSKSIIMLTFYLLKLNIYLILYISIIGIILSSFCIKKEPITNH